MSGHVEVPVDLVRDAYVAVLHVRAKGAMPCGPDCALPARCPWRELEAELHAVLESIDGKASDHAVG